jgi:hypothetical protein
MLLGKHTKRMLSEKPKVSRMNGDPNPAIDPLAGAEKDIRSKCAR